GCVLHGRLPVVRVELGRVEPLALDRPRVVASYLQLPRPRCSTLFPYTTLFRSRVRPAHPGGHGGHQHPHSGAHGVARVRRLEGRSEEHTSELQPHLKLVCRLLLERSKTGTAGRRYLRRAARCRPPRTCLSPPST